MMLRFNIRNPKNRLPMQNYTQEEFQPSPATLLFIKQFARMCNTAKPQNNGYHSFPIVACC